jgi:hypothetical protein
MKPFLRNIVVILLLLSTAFPQIVNAQGFYNKYSYRKKRHEITFGAGASSCLTDLGGRDAIGSGFLYDMEIAKTSYVAQFSYIYNLASKITLRANFAYSNISGDDELAGDFYRNNRRLNFNTTIIESALMCEIILKHVRVGNRYNLKSPAGKFIGAKNPLGIGIYIFAGVGGVFFDPSGFDRFLDNNGNVTGSGIKYKLRPLHTEGQGMEGGPEGYAPGETYLPIAVCIPMGFGLKKAFNGNAGIKLEAGFRFTNTDYLDDVSTNYYDSDKLNEVYGQSAAIMSGTKTGFKYTYVGYAPNDDNGNPIYPDGATIEPTLGGVNPYSTTYKYTEPGLQRGNPENNDGYMFVTLSAYKKLNNASKSYKTINMHQKRKIKASF